MTTTNSTKRRFLSVALAVILAGSLGAFGTVSIAYADDGAAPMVAQEETAYVYFDIAYEGSPASYGSIYGVTSDGQTIGSGAALPKGTGVHIVATAPEGWTFNTGQVIEYDVVAGNGQNFTFSCRPAVTYSVSGSMVNGSVSGGGSGFPYGTSGITLTFVANPGYEIVNPGAYGLSGGGGTYYYTAGPLTSDVNIYAEATPIPPVAEETPEMNTEPVSEITPAPAPTPTPTPSDNGSSDQGGNNNATPANNGGAQGGTNNGGNAGYANNGGNAAAPAAGAGAAGQAATANAADEGTANDANAAAEGENEGAANNAANKPASTVEDDEAPLAASIDDNATPLAAGAASSWSLFNLIAIIAAVALAVVGMVRRSDESRKTLRIAGIAIAVVGIVAFILTQHFTGSMAMFDMWSVLFAVVLVAEIALTALMARKSASTTAAA